MKEELELKLQEDFPFMQQNRVESEHNIYKKWGIECSSGWYQLIHDLCQEITDRYAVDEAPVDIVIQQIKEKFASLRFYYSYEDATCPIQAFDCLGVGISIRFQPENASSDEKTKKLRNDIAQIVRSYEEKSKTVCENCGQKWELRAAEWELYDFFFWNNYFRNSIDTVSKWFDERRFAINYDLLKEGKRNYNENL